MDNAIKSITTISPKPTDTIVLRFNEIPFDEMAYFFNAMRDKFPDNQVVVLPKSVDLEVAGKELWEDYIRMVYEVIKNLD